MNIGSNLDVESNRFFAHGWLSHSVCMIFFYLVDNMRWNRKTGGCAIHFLVGYYAEYYITTVGDDIFCTT